MKLKHKVRVDPGSWTGGHYFKAAVGMVVYGGDGHRAHTVLYYISYILYYTMFNVPASSSSVMWRSSDLLSLLLKAPARLHAQIHEDTQ